MSLIGMAFDQFEMKLVISGILLGFELALADNRFVHPVRRGITSGPSPFQMVVKEHRSQVGITGGYDSAVFSVPHSVFCSFLICNLSSVMRVARYLLCASSVIGQEEFGWTRGRQLQAANVGPAGTRLWQRQPRNPGNM
jgi:hypothetical protein